MIVGFNHNMIYRGVCFHVQTEDSGVRTPHLITLLYHGGTIISSQKTSYADILNVDNLDAVIEDLAKEQHKGMLRRLKNGEFDQRILDYGIGLGPAAAAETKPTAAPLPTAVEPEPGPEPAAVASEIPVPEPMAVAAVEQAVGVRSEPESATTDLDDLIFAYLSGADGTE